MTSVPHARLVKNEYSRVETHRRRRMCPSSPPANSKKYYRVMEDWQDAALSSKHMHNGIGRYNGKGSGRSKRNSFFNVRRSFGTYSCKCAALERTNAGSSRQANTAAALHLYRLTACGQGIVGELSLPRVLEAPIILAGSRKILQSIITGLSPDNMEDINASMEMEASSDDNNTYDIGCAEDSATQANSNEADEIEQDRIRTFEKNSFRSPKFWFQWSNISSIASASGSQWEGIANGKETTIVQAELGYLVFSGNDCRKFKGTISCSKLGWENVAISGYKIASRSESDIPMVWAQTGAAL